MPLTCSCQDADDAEWWWFAPEDYSILSTPKGRRCKSCNTLISVGATVAAFQRERHSQEDVEYRVYGDDFPLATWYLCETCADLYFSLSELGFCVSPDENMLELCREYGEMTRRKR